MKFKGKSPCKDCPYRTDAPLQKWSIEEFKELIKNDREYIGKLYYCHKKDDIVCGGWLMDQDERRFPCIALRLELSHQKIDRVYLDALSCKVARFTSIEAMAVANYPELQTKPLNI